MPPSKSGIADYSEALTSEMAKRVALSVFEKAPAPSISASFDIDVYQIGNNPCHGFALERALSHPGVAVMHEANLHHLIADLTIRRGDWDAYFAECECNGVNVTPAFREEMREQRRGPDYGNVPMTARLLRASRGLIVHSDFVARQMREQGFEGPVAVIPHGAWIPATDRNATRHELGVEPTTPLIGAFGYLKPYKRIAESLRAFRRLVTHNPRVRMILVGEPHPEFPVEQLIRTLHLQEHVRVLGFAPIEKFVDYIGASDIVLNLRYPTVGETSGSLQRALGLGKAVIVSDVGSFSELPDDICLKVPAGPDLVTQEEDMIFEYLNVLVSRPDLARAMGDRAKAWVERECNWGAVADRYVEFLDQVLTGTKPAPRPPQVPPEPVEFIAPVEPESFSAWVDPSAREYARGHSTRFIHTLEMAPAGDPSKSILEMGAYMQITPALKFKLGYGYVRGCYYGKAGSTNHKSIVSETGETFTCDVDLFDAERDLYPYPDQSFDTVLCCELIEHLVADPMHLMSEVNRILKPGGHFLITTPNLASRRAISAILQGFHPSLFPAYIRPRAPGEETDARHNREYVPGEIQNLLLNSGFEIVRLETGEFLDEPRPEFAWVDHLLDQYQLHRMLRDDGIYALGRKTGPVRERWPAWLYA
ncbi:MAG TPA: glycosyltransferase [Bryobacteraceae bacterium]|nr:glycosyltransferase [Bryobacteraceae bacterium]